MCSTVLCKAHLRFVTMRTIIIDNNLLITYSLIDYISLSSFCVGLL